MGLIYESPLQYNHINLQDDSPKIVLRNIPNEGDHITPPFYITLEFLNFHMHNCLYDYGASHSLIPLVAMEKLGLDITRPYTCIFSFDSKKFNSLG